MEKRNCGTSSTTPHPAQRPPPTEERKEVLCCVLRRKTRMEGSIVEYFGKGEGHRCGYCGNSDTSISHGMWAHRLTCTDYEDLVNRGWRRSGKYVYKPLMENTCCKLFTIRCDVTNFKLSKSQKKVLKKMKKFLQDGKAGKDSSSTEERSNDNAVKPSRTSTHLECQGNPQYPDATKGESGLKNETRQKQIGWKKAEDQQEMTECHTEQKENPAKTIEDHMSDIDDAKMLHRLEVRTVRSHPQSKEFLESFQSEYELFLKYQVAIHKETPSENPISQFKRFLVDCPLMEREAATGWPSTGLGAFHQQYFMDGKLIAVGVIDILPHCLSSKYFFYDPEFDFLSLGTFSALREIYFVRSLMKNCPSFKYYYIGYYLHACQKMRYKGNYDPSFLLCPESYKFVPIKSCIQKHDLTKYCRLNPLEEPDVYPNEKKALILHQGQIMPFPIYLDMFLVKEEEKQRNIEEAREYCRLAGEAAERMFLYRD
ncbi:arginyl-tRNA--protein transferase 1-like isoform X1 [Rhopilema esculentum]|uniref:arginyl-tRNA--protein transferase 1-like isoform X1 n=2 Tax=Rhopilema esculentum TaxID=499914 RepID=UPI0031D9B6FC